MGAGHGTSPPRIYFPKRGANGRASKTTRIDAIRSLFTRYHSQMNAVPAGVFVTMSYSMQTSSPSTNIFFGSIRSMMGWSLLRASRTGSGRSRDSKGPTNERRLLRNWRATSQSPPPRHIDPGEDDLAARALDPRHRRVEVLDPHVVHAPRDLLRSGPPAPWRLEREILAHRELHGLEGPSERPLQETPRP